MVPSTGPAYVNDPHDTIVQADIKLWPFKAMAGMETIPMTSMNCHGDAKSFHPVAVSSMFLTKMKETAKAQLGTIVNDAVVTVTAYFNDPRNYESASEPFRLPRKRQSRCITFER